MKATQSIEPEKFDWRKNPAEEFAIYEPGRIYALSGQEINDTVRRVSAVASKFTFNWVYEAKAMRKRLRKN